MSSPPDSSTADTKARLLDAAEQLFAEHGIAETSLRDITALAEANLASVNYHFGSKDALLEAVFARRIRPVNEERLARLDRIEAESGEPSLEWILDAFLGPPFGVLNALGPVGQRFMQLVGRINSDPNHSIHEAFLRQFENVRVRFHAALSAALPHLDEAEVSRRMHYVIGATLHTFSWCRVVPSLWAPEDPNSDTVLRSLIGFAAAGMRSPAPHPSPTTAHAVVDDGGAIAAALDEASR